MVFNLRQRSYGTAPPVNHTLNSMALSHHVLWLALFSMLPCHTLAQTDVKDDLNQYDRQIEAGIELYLQTTLNGADKGLLNFTYRDAALWADQAMLQQLGFIFPDANNTNGLIALQSLPKIDIHYNPRQQTLRLIAPIEQLRLDKTVRGSYQQSAPKPMDSTGVLLNYNLYATHDEDNTSRLNTYSELRAFNTLGLFSNTALTRTAHSQDTWDSDTVRLDTSWSKSFPDKLITMRAGDIITSGLSWTRSTRLGGVQIGKNFTLQPYMSTAPLPSFLGSATLPSAVELYVNGLKQYSGDVPAGPFEINTAPNFSGAGDAQLVITDALGQRQTLNFSLYDTHRLLRQGLSDWSFELGVVRKDYGIRSFSYDDDIAASGTVRYGVTPRFTAETHAELTEEIANAGVGGTWQLGGIGGVLFTSLSGSAYQEQQGLQYSGSYSWHNKRFNIGLNATGTHGDYYDIGAQVGSAPARLSAQMVAGLSTDDWGNFGLSYNHIAYEDQNSSELASLYWNKRLGENISLGANMTQDLHNSAHSSAIVGATWRPSQNRTLTSSIQHTNNKSALVADIIQRVPNSGGIGWRAGLRQDDNATDIIAELNYLNRYSRMQAGISRTDDHLYGYASAAGALVMMGGGVFPSREINSGFAVVSTNGIANVPVLLQNSPIGSTNNKGLLLVTPLNPYQENKVSINPADLPVNMRITQLSHNATPSDRAGAMVAFNIEPTQAASLIVTDEQGQFLPVGSIVTTLPKTEDSVSVVGFDGEVYIEGLVKHNVIAVTTPNEDMCQFSVDYDVSTSDADIPLLGPFICHKESE